MGKIELGAGSTCTYKPDPQNEMVCAKDVVEWIYAVLTTLDSKASALMRLNGVVIAAAAFLLGLFGRQGTTILSTGSVNALLIVGCALLSAMSIFLCLLVVNVSWPLLGRVEKKSDGTVDCSSELVSLEKTRERRQVIYRAAWWVSLAASFLFLIEFAMQTYHVFCGLSTC